MKGGDLIISSAARWKTYRNLHGNSNATGGNHG